MFPQNYIITLTNLFHQLLSAIVATIAIFDIYQPRTTIYRTILIDIVHSPNAVQP